MNEVLLPDSLREVEAVLGRRIDALERDNAALRSRNRMIMLALGGLLIVTIVLTILTAPNTQAVTDSVQARQFVLRDGGNLIRGIWEMDREGAPRMILRDNDGRDRITLSLLVDGSPGVTLGDRDGKPRVVIGVLPDGTSNIVLADVNGTARAVLGHTTSPSDATSLVLADREGSTRASIVVDPNGEANMLVYETSGSVAVPEAPEVPETAAP